MNKFYLVKFLTNTQDQDGSSIAVYDTYENAIVAYHQALTAFHNANDVKYAVVSIQTGNTGNTLIKEVVDHIPEPEPEEETPVVAG